jgi:hypothetical protein
MKIEKEHINYIQDAFAKMQTRQDFLDLLNYANPLIYGKKAVPFKLKQITYYSFPKNTNKAYKSFTVKKKSGSDRTIYAPTKGLKSIQKTLALVLQFVFQPHQAATGFVMGKSIVDNAKEHIGKNYVYNIDLKDFFPSVDQARIWSCLQLKPFNLVDDGSPELIVSGIRKFKTTKGEKIFYQYETNGDKFLNGFKLIRDNKGTLKNFLSSHTKSDGELDKESLKKEFANNLFSEKNIEALKQLKASRLKLANSIAAISCAEMEVERMDKNGGWEKVKRNVLPQGAPTSPVFSNIICQRLDKRLTGVSKRFNLKYTRYADDITFSSMHNVYHDNGEFLKELQRVITDQGFHIKESKTRLQKRGYRQEVTGLVVNDSVNVRKRYIKQLRMWLYYWEKYGYNKAEAIFTRDYVEDKGHVKKTKPNFQSVLSGKLEYLKMVKGKENSTYLSLNKRFEKLSGRRNPIDQILSEWENNGIEKAMEIYNFMNNE